MTGGVIYAWESIMHLTPALNFQSAMFQRKRYVSITGTGNFYNACVDGHTWSILLYQVTNEVI